jgi:hypothetical protein
MPRPLPIPHSTRDGVAEAIRAGQGRNELAREFGISRGAVSKIARENGLGFSAGWRTAAASQARQIDLWAARVERTGKLEQELLKLSSTQRRDGTPTKAWDRLSYALYDVDRHHNGTYRA